MEPQEVTEATRLLRSAERVLWRAGCLRELKLHEDQQRVYDAMMSRDSSREVLEIARKWGKTWLLCVIAFETCIRNPGCRVVYGAPTLKHLEEFVHPVIYDLIQDAPANVRPKWNEKRGHWEFPEDGPARGSYIHLFGAENKLMANRGRGPKAKAAIFDEAGFCAVLGYVLRSIFRPSLLHGNGRTYLGSTPAELPDHDFTRYAEIAEANGSYARRTVWDNPLLTREQIEKFIADDARDEGMSVEDYMRSDDFRREYLAERVVSKHLVVLGDDWTNKRLELIRAVPRPQFYDAYTVMDPGGNDPHAIGFGYWHFAMAKYIQEDELLLRDNENTVDIAARIKHKERELYGVELWDGSLRAAVEDDTGAIANTVPEWMRDVLLGEARPQPYLRVTDINVQLARDLYTLHKMAFLPTAKDDKQAAVNNLRVAIRQEEYLMHPRCVHTDRHWRDTTWANIRRKDYARKHGEHGDLLDVGVYTARNVNKTLNPYPRNWVAPVSPHRASAALAEQQAEQHMPRLRTARLRGRR